jgi:hypothetical protein
LALTILGLAAGMSSFSALSSAQAVLTSPDLLAAPARVYRSCGTPEPAPFELQALRATLARTTEENAVRAASGGTIKVAFHVITSGHEGEVTDAQIRDQIQELNRDYAGTGYRFELASVDRTDNAGWFKMTPGTGKERHAKQALAIDPAHRLNVYTCGPGQNLLGWSYFPFSAPEDSYIHGSVIHYSTLPGGAFDQFNLGKTATHEIGHYLGLFHTFQGGCVAPGDEVDDTPFEASAAFGCQVGRNTCPEPGDDPIHNYMDYSDDACLTEFTPGQVDRMHEIVPVYRPSLFLPAVALANAAAEAAVAQDLGDEDGHVLAFRGAFPNPFRYETAFRFTVPTSTHVTVKVYSVTGQLVQTLVDADLPPGDHSAMFTARDLPSGMYFASVRAGNVEMHKSVILVR